MNGDTAKTIDVAYVAHLARMHLSEEETRLFQGQLADVLKHIQTLQELDVEGVEPTAHAVPVENVYREDEVRPGMTQDAAMANAPQGRNGLFMVPRILE